MQDPAHQINGRMYWGKNAASLSELEKLDLVHLQKTSYQLFLKTGIGELIKEITPVTDFTGKNWQLELGEYFFGNPRFNPEQCSSKGVSYDAPLRVKVQLENLQTHDLYKGEAFLG